MKVYDSDGYIGIVSENTIIDHLNLKHDRLICYVCNGTGQYDSMGCKECERATEDGCPMCGGTGFDD